MHIIRQPSDAEAISNPLVTERLHLLDLAPIVIIEAGDSESDIINAIGFSPLVNPVDGERYPSPRFTPAWEVMTHHEGWWEIIYVTGDDGSGIILLVDENNTVLSPLCL